MVHVHFIFKGAHDVELIADGIYSDTKNRLFRLAKYIDLGKSGVDIYLENISSGEMVPVPIIKMEAYLRGKALKYEGFCSTCSEWKDKINATNGSQ